VTNLIKNSVTVTQYASGTGVIATKAGFIPAVSMLPKMTHSVSYALPSPSVKASVSAKASLKTSVAASSVGSKPSTTSKLNKRDPKANPGFPKAVSCTIINLTLTDKTVVAVAKSTVTTQQTITQVGMTTVTAHPTTTITVAPYVIKTTKTIGATQVFTVTFTTTAQAPAKTVTNNFEACYPNNQLNYTINASTGLSVSIGSLTGTSSSSFQHVTGISSPYDCCHQCFLSGNCAGSYFQNNQCYISSSAAGTTTCKAQKSNVLGSFTVGNAGMDSGAVISNGYCGEWAAAS